MPLARAPSDTPKCGCIALLVSYRTLAKQKPAPRALRPDEASMRVWKPGKPVLAAAPAAALAAWRFARPTHACKREVSCKRSSSGISFTQGRGRKRSNARTRRTQPSHKKKTSLPAAKRACTTRRRRSALPRPRLSQPQRDRRAAPVRNKNKGARARRASIKKPWPRQEPCSRLNSTSTP